MRTAASRKPAETVDATAIIGAAEIRERVQYAIAVAGSIEKLAERARCTVAEIEAARESGRFSDDLFWKIGGAMAQMLIAEAKVPDPLVGLLNPTMSASFVPRMEIALDGCPVAAMARESLRLRRLEEEAHERRPLDVVDRNYGSTRVNEETFFDALCEQLLQRYEAIQLHALATQARSLAGAAFQIAAAYSVLSGHIAPKDDRCPEVRAAEAGLHSALNVILSMSGLSRAEIGVDDSLGQHMDPFTAEAIFAADLAGHKPEDAELIELGKEFDAALVNEKRAVDEARDLGDNEGSAVVDAAADKASAIAAPRIQNLRANTPAGLAVKARAARWMEPLADHSRDLIHDVLAYAQADR